MYSLKRLSQRHVFYQNSHMHSAGTDPGLRGNKRNYSPICTASSLKKFLLRFERSNSCDSNFGRSMCCFSPAKLRGTGVDRETRQQSGRPDARTAFLMKSYLGPFPGCEPAGELLWLITLCNAEVTKGVLYRHLPLIAFI
jgi:hypothetical protein